MAREQKVKVVLEGEDRASKEIKKVEGGFGRLGSLLKKGFAAAAVAATAAFAALTSALIKGVAAAQVQEDAINDLEASLLKYGKAGDVASESAQRYASALQQQTTFGDEALIQAQALLVTMGTTPDLLNAATLATVNLAAAMGTDLTAAARNVGKTFGGLAGELGEIVPELKELSIEAFQSGAAIAILNEKFAGRAVAAAQTFSGSIQQLKNAFGDLLEVLGTAITQNENIAEALVKVREVITSAGFVDGVKSLADGISTLTTSTIDFVRSSGDFIRGLREGGQVVRELAEVFKPLAKIIELVEARQRKQAEASKALGAILNRFLIKPFLEYGRVVREGIEAGERHTKIQEAMSDAFEQQAIHAIEAFQAIEKKSDADERAERIATDSLAAQKELTEALAAAGITLRDTQGDIENQERALVLLAQAQRNAGDSTGDYQRAIDDARQKLSELRGEVDTTDVAIRDSTTGFSDATQAVREYGDEAGRTAGRLDALATSTNAASGARVNGNTGRGAFGALSGGTFTVIWTLIETLPNGQKLYERINASGERVRMVR